MSDTISLSDYAAEIGALALACATEAREFDREVSDVVHETVDGHEWIIYTHYNAQVLQNSRNDNAYFENFGPLEASGYSDAMVKMAYAALSADVFEALADVELPDLESEQAS